MINVNMNQTSSKNLNKMGQTAYKKSNNMVQTAAKKSDTMKKTKTTKKSILGIDLGSTALRAALVECEVPYHHHPVQNNNLEATQEVGAPMSAMGDFPVACCPLDPIDPLAKIGAQAVSEPGHISAKYLMYFLARIDPEVMADYPLPDGLMTHNEDEGFLEDCKTILSMLLARLRERVDAVAQRKGLFFDEIVLTIPAQWDTSFEKVYGPLVENAFASTNEEGEEIKPTIHFCGEADALARYIILHEGRELEDWDVVLFLDFGGHSMSFSLMELKRTGNTDDSGNTNLTFFELNAGGCAGGGEMWSHRIGQLISEKLSEMGEEDADEEKKTKLLNCFNRDKFGAIRRIQEEQTGVETLYCSGEQGVFTFVRLSREEIKDCLDAALAKPVRMAKEQLMELKGYSGDKKIGVVVAGGTLMSTRARELVFANSGLSAEQIKHTSEIDVQWLSSCNCIGAASAYAKKLTVAQFFEHGAVIALQQKTGPVYDASWEGFAYVLVGHDKKYVANVYNRNTGTKFKLVCNPSYAQNVTTDQNEQDNVDEAGTTAGPVAQAPGNNDSDTTNTNVQTPIEDCYDLWYLGPQLAGKLEIEASLTSPSGTASSEMTLHVSISRKNNQGTRKVKDIDLPLCLDPGHNAVHIDPDAISAEEHEQQAAWQREDEKPEEAGSKSPALEPTEPAQAGKQTIKASTEQGTETGPSGSKKSSTAKKRKRKETSNAPSSQPSKRPRTRAVDSSEEHQQLDYYATVPRKKRKATAPASSSKATKKARTDAAQDGEQIEWQPQEQPQAQEVSQKHDEDMHIQHNDQPDNNNNNVNGNTSRSTRNQNRTAANTRVATITATTRARTHTPTTTADQLVSAHTNARFVRRSGSPNRQRHRTEPLPEQQQRGQSQAQPRRSNRQQKGKSPAVASSTATQPQRQQQQQPQQQNQQRGQNPQPRPQRPIRLEVGPANRPAQPQRVKSQAGPSQTRSQAQPQAQPSQAPALTRTRQPAPLQTPSRPRARQSDGEILDSITVAGRAERVIAASQEEEDKHKKDEEDEEDDDVDNGNDGDDDNDGDDPDQGDDGGEGLAGGISPELGEAALVLPPLGSTRLPPSSSQRLQQPQQQQRQQKQTLRAVESSVGGSRGQRGSTRGQGVENEAGEGSTDQRVIIRRNPLLSSQPRRQTRASASSSRAQGQQQAGGGTGSSRVSAAERNKENEREQMIGIETTAVAGTGEPARRRPTREEKGKGKVVDKHLPKLAPKPAPPPAPAPRPTATSALIPRAFNGPGLSAAASSSVVASSFSSAPGPASAGPSTAQAPKSKPAQGKGKGKGKAQRSVAPAITTNPPAASTSSSSSSSSSATTIPNSSPPSQRQGRGGAPAVPDGWSHLAIFQPTPSPRVYPRPTANMAELLAGGSSSAVDVLLASTAATPGQNPPNPNPEPEPQPTTPAVRSTDNGTGRTGTDDVDVVQRTTPRSVPGYAPASRAGWGTDGDGTEGDGVRRQVGTADGNGEEARDGEVNRRDREEDKRDVSRDRRDSVEEGSRLLRSGRRNVHPFRRIEGKSSSSRRAGGSSASNANANAASSSTLALTAASSRKKARDGDEGRASSSTRSQLHAQEDDEASRQPPQKRQKTGSSSSSNGGSNGSSGSKGSSGFLERSDESVEFESFSPEEHEE